MEFAEPALNFLQRGFNEVNAVQGLLIALVTALALPSWRRLPVFVLAAAVIHILIDILAPVFANGAQFRLPPMFEVAFWRSAGTLLLGYAVVIPLFAMLKRLFLRG